MVSLASEIIVHNFKFRKVSSQLQVSQLYHPGQCTHPYTMVYIEEKCYFLQLFHPFSPIQSTILMTSHSQI